MKEPFEIIEGVLIQKDITGILAHDIGRPETLLFKDIEEVKKNGNFSCRSWQR